MCGRAYATYTEEELYLRYLNEKAKQKPLGFKPNYNLSPTQSAPIVLVKDGALTVEQLRFGLVPFWAKDIKSAAKYSLINAKGEEIETKRSYKQAFERKRCIIPLSGFYEWKRDGDAPKRPFAIHLKNEPIMSVAGVWEHWESKDSGEIVDSFAIITTGANTFMSKIHDRMPVILSRANETAWLDPESRNVASLKKLLKSCDPKQMEMFEVSTLVNSPKNNSVKLLEPVES